MVQDFWTINSIMGIQGVPTPEMETPSSPKKQ